MKLLKLLYGAAAGAVIFQSFAVPDAERFLNPRLARIIFYHLPCALVTTVFLFVGVFYSVRYLQNRQWQNEVKAAAANEMGFMLAILTMVTGVLFSKVQWGQWWQWDPRQTSFLLVLLMFGAYSALRMAIDNEEKRAVASAAYWAACAVPSAFLIFVFPRMPSIQNQSFHPSQTIASGGFDRAYSMTILEMLAVLLVFALWAYRARVATGLLEYQQEISNEGMDDRRRAPTTGVVRTVHVPTEDRSPVESGPGSR